MEMKCVCNDVRDVCTEGFYRFKIYPLLKNTVVVSNPTLKTFMGKNISLISDKIGTCSL